MLILVPLVSMNKYNIILNVSVRDTTEVSVRITDSPSSVNF